MRALIDASALVKLLIREPGTALVRRVWEQGQPTASRLAYPEVRSALARARRAGRLTPVQHVAARGALDRIWSRLPVVELDHEIALGAGQVADTFGLRAGDAVHLASALALGQGTVVVTFDDRLARAALAVGLAVAGARPDR